MATSVLATTMGNINDIGVCELGQKVAHDGSRAGARDFECNCSAEKPTRRAATARGTRIPNPLKRSAPASAPPNIAMIDSARRPLRAPLPPASDESAARPVTVNVSTVVVRSGTASFRTTALRSPIANAAHTITAYAVAACNSAGADTVSPAARSNNTHSALIAAKSRSPGDLGCRLATLPASRLPHAKTHSAVTERSTDKP